MTSILSKITANLGLKLFVILIVLSLFDSSFFNETPWLAKKSDQWSLAQIQKVKPPYEKRFGPLVPYRYDQMNLEWSLSSPLTKGPNGVHWFGTDSLGRDVLSMCMRGLKLSLFIGVLACLIALSISLFLNFLAGFIDYKKLTFTPITFLLTCLLGFILLFYTYFTWFTKPDSFLLFLVVFLFLLFNVAQVGEKLAISFEGDPLITSMLNIFKSLPSLLVVLVLASLFDRSGLWGVSILIGLIIWPLFTRIIRAEIMAIKEQDYIIAAKLANISYPRLYFKHLLVNIYKPLFVVSCFAINGVILLEATLSFLGIGVPLDAVTLGSLISGARTNIASWWLIVFPGLFLFYILYFFSRLSNIFK